MNRLTACLAAGLILREIARLNHSLEEMLDERLDLR